MRRAIVQSMRLDATLTLSVSALANQFPKRCGCKRSYASVEEFRALPLANERRPYYVPSAPSEDEPVLECRNCACGSTLALAVTLS